MNTDLLVATRSRRSALAPLGRADEEVRSRKAVKLGASVRPQRLGIADRAAAAHAMAAHAVRADHHAAEREHAVREFRQRGDRRAARAAERREERALRF